MLSKGDNLRNAMLRAHSKFISLDQSNGQIERRKPFLPYQKSFDEQLLEVPIVPDSPHLRPPISSLLVNFVKPPFSECSDSQSSTPIRMITYSINCNLFIQFLRLFK